MTTFPSAASLLAVALITVVDCWQSVDVLRAIARRLTASYDEAFAKQMTRGQAESYLLYRAALIGTQHILIGKAGLLARIRHTPAENNG